MKLPKIVHAYVTSGLALRDGNGDLVAVVQMLEDGSVVMRPLPNTRLECRNDTVMFRSRTRSEIVASFRGDE